MQVNPGSQLQQDGKNSKLFEWIVIAAMVVLPIAGYFMSSQPFARVRLHPALWIVPVITAGWAVFCIVEVLKMSSLTEEAKWPYILGIILLVASLVILYWPIQTL